MKVAMMYPSSLSTSPKKKNQYKWYIQLCYLRTSLYCSRVRKWRETEHNIQGLLSSSLSSSLEKDSVSSPSQSSVVSLFNI